MPIRDPDVLLAVIAQLKSQIGTQIADWNDALAVANVQIAMLRTEIEQLKDAAAKTAYKPDECLCENGLCDKPQPGWAISEDIG